MNKALSVTNLEGLCKGNDKYFIKFKNEKRVSSLTSSIELLKNLQGISCVTFLKILIKACIGISYFYMSQTYLQRVATTEKLLNYRN